MRMVENPKDKTVEIWLTQAESQDAQVNAQLEELYSRPWPKGYQLIVFYSGTRDLLHATSDLLCYNRKKLS